MSLQKKLDKRADLVKGMRDIFDSAKTDKDEKRALTADEASKYQNMETELKTVQNDIRDAQFETALASVENSLEGGLDNYTPTRLDFGQPASGHFSAAAAYRDAFFNSYTRKGSNGLTPEVLNALQEGTDSEGGYIVPEEFETKLIELQSTMDPVRQMATVIQTRSLKNIPIEASEGGFAYIDEEGAYPEDDPSFGRVIIGAHKSGGIIKVSDELLQDSFFKIPSYLRGLAARRYNSLEEVNFATGNGSAKPLGIFATTSVGGISVAGFQGAVSALPVIIGDDLVETFHSLARSYRQNAAWLTSDAMVKKIRLLKDSDGNYLWQPGLTAGQPDRILNRPVHVSEGAPVPAADGKAIMFGDFSQYFIADRLGMTVQRLNELYAKNGQRGFQFTKRNDARLVDANAFTYFQHGAAS